MDNPDTPLFRRLTNERRAEVEETYALWDRVAYRTKDDLQEVLEAVIAAIPYVPKRYAPAVVNALVSLARDEAYLSYLPPRDVSGLTLAEFASHRNFLHKKLVYLQRRDAYQRLIVDVLTNIFEPIIENLPDSDDDSPFCAPLILTVPEPKRWVQHIYECLHRPELIERGIFDPISVVLSRNLAHASGFDPNDVNPKKPIVYPAHSTLKTSELLDVYLRDTVFYDLFQLQVPLSMGDRFSHMHVLGGTGAGKTTLLENIILHDLKSPHRPALVIVDSQGDLIRKISHLKLWEDNDDFILISPKDVAHPPALNVFDVNQDRLGKYDQATREQVIAGVIQTFDYLFSGLLGADLTAKQNVFFKYVARLMLSLPETIGRNATILDMLALMDDPSPYQDAIKLLPPIQRSFFERDFSSKTFVQTKEQIRYRLHAIIENPTLARLFTSPTTKVDLFSALNDGKVILVDTAKDFLKGSSAHFGQIFISLVLQAVLERAAIPREKRRDTFIIVDEAAEYFDSNIDDLLTEVRKFNCGCVFAHQYLDQCTGALRASLAANTTIKFAGGLSASDARAMAPEMRTTADFILGQPRLHFAAHIRNVTSQAVSVPVIVGQLDKEPTLSVEAYEAMLARNRERVAYQPEAHAAPKPATQEMSDDY